MNQENSLRVVSKQVGDCGAGTERGSQSQHTAAVLASFCIQNCVFTEAGCLGPKGANITGFCRNDTAHSVLLPAACQQRDRRWWECENEREKLPKLLSRRPRCHVCSVRIFTKLEWVDLDKNNPKFQFRVSVFACLSVFPTI